MAANNLTYQFKTANVLIKLIVINVAVYLLTLLIPFLFNFNGSALVNWFSLPSDLGAFILRPWSLITYAFFHASFGHIFWNMIVLYWFGRIVLNLFSEKRFLTIYFLSAIAGGLLYMLAYNLFPVFYEVTSVAVLIGASAAVRGIMIFMAAHSPQSEVRLIFFNVKLWQIAVFVIISDLIAIPSGNAGGMLAHLGGAAFGYVYAQQLAKGNDIGLWWENMLAGISNYFSKKEKKPKMKTVYRNTRANKRTASTSSALSKSEKQQKIDTILDKISKSGYESLSKTEKDFLFQSGKEN